MTKSRIWLIIVVGGLIFIFLTGFQQGEGPSPGRDYFRLPIDHTPRLSGTFGELRWNHFHTGLDFKSSNGRAGDPIVAVQRGFISRIKIEEDGYGRAVYIDHPNGMTSVYGHLSEFSNKITRWVRERQYAKKSFRIDSRLPDSVFRVKKGQKIGKMGNTGSSTGVHLHFELRHTESEIPCNALLLGYEVADSRRPDAIRMKWSVYDEQFNALNSDVLRLLNKGKGRYSIRQDTLRIPAGMIGLAVQTTDQLDGAWNRNGVFGMRLYRDSVREYAFEMRCIPFPDSRYINTHIDYDERYHRQRYYHRLFQFPGNQLEIYKDSRQSGFMSLDSGETAEINIEIFDVAGNTSTLQFPVKARGPLSKSAERSAPFINPEAPFRKTAGGFSLFIPEGSVYKPLPFTFSREEKENEFPVFHILEEDIPLHKEAILHFSLEEYPAEIWSKMHIQRKTEQSWQYAGGRQVWDVLVGRLDQLGTLRLAVDTIPPNIRPLSVSRNLRGWNRISFRIEDVAGAKPLNFEGCIDGRWVLMEYDEKRRRLTHELSDTLSRGQHHFELSVWDDRHNEAQYSLTFQR